MNGYLADGSFLELSKEQLKCYRLNSSLYTQQRVKQLEEALDEIEEYCKDQNLKHNYTDGVILDIINKAKEK